MPKPEFSIPLSAPDLTETDVQRVLDVLRGPRLSRGSQQTQFEQRFAERSGAPHAVAVSSGTAGLHLALTVLGTGPDHEVITSPFAVPATANAIRQTGARVVFADIEPHSLNLDPASARQAMSERTRAVLAVHTFGLPADMAGLKALGVPVLEDACEALGTVVDEHPVGSLGDLGVFGFYPNKQITTGEGGMVVTANAEHADRIRALRNHGRRGDAWLDQWEPGFNYRLGEMACALGLAQLNRLDEILQRREAIATRYCKALQDIPGIRLPTINPDGRHSWFVFVIRFESPLPATARDRILFAMAERGIQCGRYFAPLHLQPVAQNENHARFPVTEAVAQRTLALPFFNRITGDQMDAVCAALLELLEAERRRCA